jgi:tRNA (cmo5U34)-methyltransferase
MNDFDDKAKQWDQNLMHLERTKAVAKEMLSRIPIKTSMKALEFGAGTGLLSFYLKGHFAEIMLMDTSREMLNMAEMKLDSSDQKNITTCLFDLEKMTYTGEKFDIIFSQMVLHHIKDVKTILGKFSKMLNPGGYLAIADLYPEDGSFHDPGAEVHPGFDPDELAIFLKAGGFDHVSVNQCFVIRKQMGTDALREYPVFLLTAMNR